MSHTQPAMNPVFFVGVIQFLFFHLSFSLVACGEILMPMFDRSLSLNISLDWFLVIESLSLHFAIFLLILIVTRI